MLGGGTTTITVTVSNPASNAYTITGVAIIAPSGWTVAGASCLPATSFLPVCSSTSAGATASVSQFTVGTAAGVPPGLSDSFTVTVNAPTGTYPFTGTFTTKVQDASAVAFYNGPSFSTQVIDPTTSNPAITVTPATGSGNTETQYTAGTAPYTVTAQITPAQAGVSIVWSDTGTGANDANYPSSFSSASTKTDSTGTATVTYQPGETAGDTGIISATVGTSSLSSTAPAITTVAGAPTAVAFVTATATDGNDYSTTTATTTASPPTPITGDAEFPAGGISFKLADNYGNAVSLGTLTAYTITITALSGGGFFDAAYATSTAYPAVISCTNGGNWQAGGNDLTIPGTAACPSGAGPYFIPYNYFQSGVYGAIGKLALTITGTPSFSGSGNSANLVTSSFSSAFPTLTVTPPTGATLATVPAGSSVTVSAALATPQAGVPVTLYLDHATSYESASGAMDYSTTAAFAGGGQGTTLASASGATLGTVSSTFAVDTCANQPTCPTGAHAFFLANFAQPTNALGPNNMFGNSSDFATPAITAPGTPASFTIMACFVATLTPTTCTTASGNLLSHTAAAGATAYIDASISDAYGNTAFNPGPNQIQINLAAPGSALSVTSAYITTNNPDTYSSLGWVAWTFPNTVGTTITLTASGVLSGVAKTATYAVTTVSPSPTIAITSPAPVNGVIYSKTGSVVFSGGANVSTGFATTVTIASVGYKVDSNPWQSAIISSGNKVLFSVAASMTTGVHTVTFNATDSLSHTVTSQTYKVLVDTAAPTVKFTTATGASVGAGQTVNATITVAQGDLNATSVMATVNGTALASSHVTVTGTNNLGTSVTYTVQITGLTAGTDVLGLSATSLAGLTGTATTITVTVTVPFSQSVTVTSATFGTLGAFQGMTVTATNNWSTSQNLVVFAVFKNSAGQTVGVATGGLTLASGATGTTFAPLTATLPSGAYTVSVFVITTSNNPVSLSTSVSVTA